LNNDFEVFVRFYKLNYEDNIRDLKNDLIGKLINIRGVITKRTIVSPQMKKVMLICNKCSDKYGPLILTD